MSWKNIHIPPSLWWLHLLNYYKSLLLLLTSLYHLDQLTCNFIPLHIIKLVYSKALGSYSSCSNDTSLIWFLKWARVYLAHLCIYHRVLYLVDIQCLVKNGQLTALLVIQQKYPSPILFVTWLGSLLMLQL